MLKKRNAWLLLILLTAMLLIATAVVVFNKRIQSIERKQEAQ